VAALSIPKDDRAGLALVREVPEGVLNDLLLAIEKSPASPIVNNLSPDDIERIMGTLTTMYRIRAIHDVPLDEFVSDICESLLEHGELTTADEPKFRERLTKVLDIEALKVASKAVALQNENERNFCTARILTDARPIFGNNVSAPPEAAVITHTMKLSYHEGAGGRIHDIYVVLGSHDLADLREVLDRAEEKAKSLRNFFSKANMRFIDPQEE
jgi:hypothetical protein